MMRKYRKQLLILIGATLSVGMLLSSCSGDEDANVGEGLLLGHKFQ